MYSKGEDCTPPQLHPGRRPASSQDWHKRSEPEFLNFLNSPRFDSKEPIPPAYKVAWRAGTITLFLLDP
jgi:hypothetical protein